MQRSLSKSVTRKCRHSLLVGVLAGLWCVLLSATATGQTPPGTLAEFRERLEEGATCYDQVDYRCVISALEGPLLVRDELPSGVESEEVELAYELLGLGYLSVGLDAEGRRTFDRLLELQPDYRLERTDASPGQVELVETLRGEREARTEARGYAAHVRVQAQLVAITPQMKQRAILAAVRFSAVAVAAAVVTRARWVADGLSDPPMGPLSPYLEVGAVSRIFFGDDAHVWDPGVGVSAAIGVDYWPLYAALSFAWTRHESLLVDAVISPPPPLDVSRFFLELGLGWRWPSLVVRTALVGGVEWLLVTQGLQSVNPAVGGKVDLGWRFGAGFSLNGSVTGVWTFGKVSHNGEASIGASFSTGIGLGLGYSF